MRLLVAVMLLAAPGWALQEPARAPVTLTLDDVLKLVHAGVSEEIIVARIKRFNKPFDLNSDEILELKKAGVSDTIVKFLLDPAPPYVPPPPPQPPPAPAKVEPPPAPPPPPKDPLTLKVPAEPGIYWLSKATPGKEGFELLEMKPVVPLKRGGKMSSMLSGGLMKSIRSACWLDPSPKSVLPRRRFSMRGSEPRGRPTISFCCV